MSTAINLPNYAKNFEISSLGLYGHNIILTGQTSATGRAYNAIQVISDCTISYVSAFPAKPFTNTDATVTALALTKGTTIILGCVKDIAVTGTNGKIIAHLISITE
tara:strand:- start:525 stop:842 length:318 start_codon:yes stop_codon:yes gene_type:complete